MLEQNEIDMNTANRNFIFFITLAYFLIIFAGFRPIGFDFDSESYFDLIYNDYKLVEPTFLLVRYFAELFSNDVEIVTRVVFLTYAFLNILILSIAINKFVRFNIISLLLYTFTAYAMITITQIRFGVAVAFFLWAVYDLANSNRKGFLFKILIATSFHYSLALALPLFFLNPSSFNRSFYFFLPVVFSLALLLKDDLLNLFINIVSMLSDDFTMKLQIYAKRKHESTMPLINFLSIFLVTIYYLFLIRIKQQNIKNIYIVAKVFGWGLAFYFLMSFAEVFSKRIMFTLSTLMIVLIPFIIVKFKQKVLIVFLLMVYVFLYFINLTVNNGLLDYQLYFSHGIF